MTGFEIGKTKAAPACWGDVLVLGLGKSGMATAKYCLGLLGSRVKSLTIAAGEKNDAALEFAAMCEARGARVYFDSFTFERSYDVCVASPGISQFSRFYENAAAASGEVISEVEFAWRESPSDSRWIAVTGTNGKTTTTSLIAHILKCAGIRAAAVGNIGYACIEAVAASAADVYVCEASSFQLASCQKFAPDVAVLLNITPDHLYWHMTFDAYADAKKRVYANLSQHGGTLVIDAVCDVTRACIKEFKDDGARAFDYVPIGCASGIDSSMKDACGSKNAAFLSGDMLRVDLGESRTDLVRENELKIKGEHNISNALAAASAALAFGVSPASIREGLSTFEPLEHRLEPCGEISGVKFINDSKATNVDATLKALSAFPSHTAIFLLGGNDKGTDLSELVAACDATCKAVVCFGAAGERFYEAFENAQLKHVLVDHMEDALDAAISMASAGDEVVLSPACSSFDEFESFEHRGKVFKQLVAFRAAATR